MKYRPLGCQKEKIANIRIITATNESIAELVGQGCFRKDLYYRINIINVLLPPLRERSGDITLLTEHFVRQFQIRYNQPRRKLHPNSMDALKYYDWPGNIRELENLLHREFLLADGDVIVLAQFTDMIKERRKNKDRRFIKMFDQPLVKAKNNLINEFEQQYLLSALNKANGNISEAARLAGKERRSFTRLLEKHDLDSTQIKSQY
jgi:DNA-binding NtrC family response regulator